MESDLTHSDSLWKAAAWFNVHKKQVIYGAGAVVAVAAIISILVWQRGQRETKAANALSDVQVAQNAGGMTAPGAGEAFLKVAAEYPGTSAAQNAILLAAGALFAEKKYTEALTQFQKFARDYSDSSLAAQAQFGIATCQESLGKTNEAVAAYNEVIQRHGSSPVAPRGKYGLARIYVRQGKADQARLLLEDITKTEMFSMVGREAGEMLEELRASHPEWAAAAQAAALAPVVSTNKSPALTPAPTNAPAPKK